MAARRPRPLPAHADDPPKAGVAGDPKVNLLRKITLAWTQYRAFRASLAELEGYSDRELRDLGITRHDIAGLAYAEAERRVEAPAPGHPAHAATFAAARA
jgi:uncharacterized protein YjiS (DUF1127 family)